MKATLFFRLPVIVFLVSAIIISFSTARAEDLPRYTLGGEIHHGGSAHFNKAGGDTINLMAGHNDPTNGPGEPAYFGDFEDASGQPDWNGWTHWDITQPTVSHWNISDYNQPVAGNLAAWCGDIAIASCGEGDPDGGYGNSWHDLIEFRQTVPNTGVSSTVTVTADLIHDSEPGYDYTYLSYRYQGQPYADMQNWDGAGSVAVSNSVTFLPPEYLDGTDIAVYFRFKSDAGWSDEDCSFPSAGGCQVDDINVHISNGDFEGDFFEDFEPGDDPYDFGLWAPVLPLGVGDFAGLWEGLQDVDPCVTNFSAQVAFIDDGAVVPGTGGSECINWCYGPSGYIVNTTGGLLGPSEHIHNAIQSPVMAWPEAKNSGDPDPDGINLTFSVYRHEDLSADAPGIFYTWGVRSADTDNSEGNGFEILAEQAWRDRNFVYYGGPGYLRYNQDVTELMVSGRDSIQVQLAVYELGWIWNWNGNDGYPAPYFDNVTVKVFPKIGPAMSAREIDLAQDNFPERGTIDYGDLGSHHVRFDMAKNISLNAHLRNDPGDSIVVNIVPTRSGAYFDGKPLMHYRLKRNPVFDLYRSSGLPDEGQVIGRYAETPTFVSDEYWAFDLPDTGFFYPGDELRYFISATDAIGGTGGTDPETSILPADTTGFSAAFGNPMGYNSSFTVRALPTIRDNGFGDLEQPGFLFINDFANRGGENEWYTALNNFGAIPGEDYDIYYVNGPSSGVGNGIGGRANHLLLTDYEDILYTAGDLGVNTLANGDFQNDPGNDVGALKDWIDQGDKDIFLTGDNLAGDLAQSGSATGIFLEYYMGVSLVNNDLRPLLGNQATPRVLITQGLTNPDRVFYRLSSWIAYGGCPGFNTFDGVNTMGGAVRLAEFTDPNGNPGSFSYSAATLNRVGTSRVISLPMDLMFIYTDPYGSSSHSMLADRTLLLHDVLNFFGISQPVYVVDVPEQIVFSAANHPNPFNPATTITYAMPRAGHLKLSVYNVRGQLVKTLIDGERPAGAGQTIKWDGKDNLGSAAASGVYFYEARAAGEVKIGKMTLLK
jgi:hypothetical protein